MHPSYITGGKRSAVRSKANIIGFAARWRAAAYSLTVFPFILLVVLAWLYPEFNEPNISDWKPTLARADLSWEKGNFAEARHLYLQAVRLASWGHHWEGLVAAACGIKRLDSLIGYYATTHDVLVRAMVVAERRHSRKGLATIAKVFENMRRHEAATMVLAKIQPHWPTERNDSFENYLDRCWSPAPADRSIR